MTEEEKAATAAAKEKADAEFEASLEGLSDEEKTAKQAERAKSSSQIDYEAELKKEREARKKAEDSLAERRFKEDEAKRMREAAGQGGADDDKPLTKKEMESLFARERQAMESRIFETEAERIAKELAGSDAEAELTLEFARSTQFPSHFTVRDRIEAAHVIANRKRIIAERNEAMRALKGQDGISDNSAGTHHDPPASPVKGDADIKFVLTQQGFTENRAMKRYEKKTPNGKLLIADPKTGKISLA